MREKKTYIVLADFCRLFNAWKIVGVDNNSSNNRPAPK